jgi:hypothetical protein
MRLVLVACLLGCGSKKPARDCQAYADKVADLGDPAPGKRDMVIDISTRACERGRISDRELACVSDATSRAQLIECTTGRPAIAAEGPSTMPDAATIDAPRGTNAVNLVAAQNGQGFHPLDLATHADQREWFAGLQRDIAACATDEVFDPPRQYVAVVTFSPETPAVFLGSMPAPLSDCVKAVLVRRQPASVGNGPAELFIDVGR